MTAYQNLMSYVQEFIGTHVKYSKDYPDFNVNDMQDCDLEDFAMHLVEYDISEKEDWCFVTDTNESRELCGQLVQLSLNPYANNSTPQEKNQDFVQSLKSNAVKYYRNRMAQLIDDYFHEWEICA